MSHPVHGILLRRQGSKQTISNLPPLRNSVHGGGLVSPSYKSAGLASPSYKSSGPSVSSISTPQQKGPSLIGILASKRLARRFADRVAQRRAMGWFQGSQWPKEPTYRMEPTQKFNGERVREVTKEIVDARLQDFSYSSKRCTLMSRVLTEEVRDRVKRLEADRYKIVCVVTMGQKGGQSLRLGSRCAWDTKTDTSVTYSWENSTTFCVVTVFGVYHE